MNENTIGILILLHAIFGGVALLCGSGALISKKGSSTHKVFGKVFACTISISAIVAIIISLQQSHSSPFLFSIGILSLYFTLSGYRAVQYKSKITYIWFDYTIACLLIISSLYMIIYPLIVAGRLPLLFAVFGALGIIFGVRGMLMFGDKDKLQKNWLKLHIGNITGAYISALTAFIVVNQWIPGIWGWIAPGVIGGFYIAYWLRKV